MPVFRFNLSHLPLTLFTLPLAFFVESQTAIAQPITSAGDGTGTVVNQNGTDFAITGGSLSGDGGNLFHNFSDFNLDATQSATFLAHPNIQNILSKVSGGNPSYIDGLLNVSNSNANLFLLNPSGIVFGSNAQLNLAGDFTASTASSVSFGDEVWTENANYANLIGAPTQFSFDGTGAIINAADLAVAQGQTLNLFASNVVNTGSLTAPEGKIQIVAIPDTNTLRLSQVGQILSLEFEAPTGSLNATNLPELLTGSSLDTGLSLNNGAVVLNANQSIIATESGAATITGNLDVSGQIGGAIAILGENIALIDANLDASGVNGGGEILVGGDYQGQGDLPRAATTFIDQNSVLNASATDNGDGGRVIIWSDEHTDFDGYLFAKGGVNGGDGGFAEISSKGLLDLAAGWSQRVDVSAINGTAGTLLLDPTNIFIKSGSGIPITSSPTSDSVLFDGDISFFLDFIGDLIITTASAGSDVGNITSESGVRIEWNSPNSLTLNADNNIIIDNNVINHSGSGNITFQAENNIETENLNINHSGIGNITFQAQNTIDLTNPNIYTNGELQISGNQGIDINRSPGVNYQGVRAEYTLLNSNTGYINISDNVSGADLLQIDGNQGISINDSGYIQSLNILLNSDAGDIEILTDLNIGGGAELTINAFGDITTQVISGSSSYNASNVLLQSQEGNIQTDYIHTNGYSFDGSPLKGGNIQLIAPNGFIRVTGTSFETFIGGFGSSLSAIGVNGAANGNILIVHGGNGDTPFTVGDSSINGTASRIDTGVDQVLPTQSFAGNYTLGNIKIQTNAPPVTETPVTETPETETAAVDESCFLNCENDSQDISSSTQIEASDNIELTQVSGTLSSIYQQTKKNPALVYVLFSLPESKLETVDLTKQNTDAGSRNETQWEFKGDRLTDFLNASTDKFLNPSDEAQNVEEELELAIVTSDGQVIRQRVAGVTRGMVMREARSMMRGITNPQFSDAFLAPSQQLYNYLIRPLEAELERTGTENISFIMDEGLRTLPMAALHDGEQFIIEKYSIGMMPSFSLTNTSGYVPPQANTLLAMGASKFIGQTDLPAASLEVDVITNQIWQQGDDFLDEDFTVENLIAARQRKPYSIVHLATHGEFLPGKLEDSYIQFQDRKLPLSELNSLGLNNPPIELLILSACRTAYGDRNAELGFAGLALASGAKAAIGSMWYVSDEGTLALMTRLYQELRTAPIKAEALRLAQLALLKGEVRIENDQLISDNLQIPLPEALKNRGNKDFSHPFFWSAFTLVGNPW